jgi:hypothetical protein
VTSAALLIAAVLSTHASVDVRHDPEPRRRRYKNPIGLIVDMGIRYEDIAATRELREIALIDTIPGDPGFVGRAQLAFRYRFVSLFNLNVWTWNGEHVIHADRAWVPLSEEGVKRLRAAGMMLPQVPLTYTFPPGALPIAVSVAGWLWWKWRSRHQT